MRTRRAKQSAKPDPASLTIQAQALTTQRGTAMAANPLQQPLWQPAPATRREQPRHPPNSAHPFSFAHIPVLSGNRIQAKLSIGKPNDKYEQEADRVADRVMQIPNTPLSMAQQPTGGGLIQRTCATCANEYSAAADENRPVEENNLCTQCRVQTKPLADHITHLVQRQSDTKVKEEEEEKTVQASPTPGQAVTASPPRKRRNKCYARQWPVLDARRAKLYGTALRA